MKNTVIYATKSGHSRKIANAIAQGINCQTHNITENPILEQVDNLFIVGGIYGNKSSPELLTYITNLTNQNIKKVILVTSSTAKVTKQEEVRDILTKQGIPVDEEEYTCQGAFLVFGLGHPNMQDISQAVEFAKRKTI